MGDHALLSWATITCRFTQDDHLHYQVFLTPRWPFEKSRWIERSVLWVKTPKNANKPWFTHKGSLFCTVPLPVLLKCPFEEHEILIPVCAWTKINVCVYCLVWFNKNTGCSNWQSHGITARKWGQTWIFHFLFMISQQQKAASVSHCPDTHFPPCFADLATGFVLWKCKHSSFRIRQNTVQTAAVTDTQFDISVPPGVHRTRTATINVNSSNPWQHCNFTATFCHKYYSFLWVLPIAALQNANSRVTKITFCLVAVNNLHLPNNKKITSKSTTVNCKTLLESSWNTDKSRQTYDRGCCIHNCWKNQCFVLPALSGLCHLKGPTRQNGCFWTLSICLSSRTLLKTLPSTPSFSFIPTTPNNAGAPSLAKLTGRPYVPLNLPKWHRGAKQKIQKPL